MPLLINEKLVGLPLAATAWRYYSCSPVKRTKHGIYSVNVHNVDEDCMT